MFRPKWTRAVILFFSLVLIAHLACAQEAEQSEREAMYYRYLEFPSYVKGGSIEPHWMADGSSFWYAEGAPANTVIWKIDPKANTKTPLFDTARLRRALAEVLGHEPPYQGLPFEEFTFADQSEKAVKFSVDGKEFILQLDTYMITRAPSLSQEEKNRMVPQIVRRGLYGARDVREVLSPDGRWFATLKDHNLWLRSTVDGSEVQLTSDGVQDYEWGHDFWNRWLLWSPDSSKLTVAKGDYRNVPKAPIVHYLKPRPDVEWVYDQNPWIDEPIAQTELYIFDIRSKQKTRLETGQEPAEYYYPYPGWRPDGSELLFQKMGRGYKKLELLAADPKTGATKVVLTETAKTFLVGIERLHEKFFAWLSDGKRFIWMSERDGWRHLYLYSLDGTLMRRLTQGSFPVVEIVAVDEKNGWIYFTAHAEPGRPYDTHLYRVNLEGKGFSRLTEGTGQHAIPFSPSKEFFIDRHSSIDRPPTVELRRADGKLLQVLAKANIDALRELKWIPPEEFVVKAADGKTDLYGVLYKPYNFDPSKKYPVVEVIYGGEQSSVVQKTFTYESDLAQAYYGQAAALAQLGFITFIVDARGTPGRGKAFQDVDYGNIGRSVILDHVAALRQLAEKRPYMDLSRVGIFGYSRGGYAALRAMLLASDTYHVGVAGAGMVDAARWVYYMGLPESNPEGYAYASNLPLAGNLKGKLLLIVGTSDVRISQTMKMVDALVRAGKPFDLLILPERGHIDMMTDPYWREAIRRYFQEHLKP